METNKVYQICKQIAKDNKLSQTNDILIAIAKGYERGYDDCARFASNLIDNEFNRTEGCDKSETDFCHVVYVDDPDCLCGIKIGRKENTSDDSNR